MGRGTQTPWTNPDLQRLFKAWHDGEEIGVICVRFGRTEGAIRAQLNAAGVKRTPEKISQMRRDIANKLWKEIKG
tara:strand:- start:471 stop:695 length:225 start_codon:yes stop_codon:yes gene_type:complete